MSIAVVHDLFVILVVGMIAGVVAKRLGFSMLVGYLLAGAVVGGGGLGLVAEDAKEIEHLAHAGALLLLFAIGIEFSLEELARLGRSFLVGGSLQFLLVAAPATLACKLLGMATGPALLIGAATALSSTVLVFRALAEWGETASPHGRRAIAILLFQDVALVPLMLIVPLLAGADQGPQMANYLLLALNTVVFVGAVLVLRAVFARWIVPLLSALRSVELVVLFGLIVLVGFCLGAEAAGLPAALGAFAAGIALSGNRLTAQIDALILPYRESFGVVFFVSLGTLLDPGVLIDEPLLLTGALLAVVVIKAGGAAVALRAAGLRLRAAAGMGIGLAQMGELSFMLLAAGVHAGVIAELNYNRMLFVAMGTLILTPQLLKWGVQWTRRAMPPRDEVESPRGEMPPAPQRALVVGVGPIGRQAASQLEISGIDVCLIDLSPVNLHAYAQQGFRTVSGHAADPAVLNRADAAHSQLAIVCVPVDRVALQIVKALHRLNPACRIVVRCRFVSNHRPLEKAGASMVVSEEAAAATAMLRLLKTL